MKFKVGDDPQLSIGYLIGDKKFFVHGGTVYDSKDFKDNWEKVKEQLGDNVNDDATGGTGNMEDISVVANNGTPINTEPGDIVSDHP